MPISWASSGLCSLPLATGFARGRVTNSDKTHLPQLFEEDHADQVCKDSACQCSAGATACGNACVDTQTSLSNCGACGNVCASPLVCQGGACVCPFVMCGEACIDTQSEGLNCGSCGHDCLGGACKSGACQPITLVADGSYGDDLVMDSTRLYWLATDRVLAAPKAGGTATVLADKQLELHEIALGPSSVYFKGSYDWAGLRAVPLWGGPVTVLVPYSGGPTVKGIAAGPSGIYFTDQTGRAVQRMPHGGGPMTPIVSGIHFGNGSGSIAVDATSLAFTANDSNDTDNVYLAPIAGGTAALLARMGSFATAFTMDATSVYWGEYAPNRIVKVSRSGGVAITLASLASAPYYLALDDSYVYWTSGELVMRVPVGGGPAVEMAKGESLASGIAVDATSVYWSSALGIRRLAK